MEGVPAFQDPKRNRIVLVLHRPRALDGSNNYTRELAKDTWAAILILFSSSFLLWKLFFSYCNSEVHSAWGQGLITNFRIFCNMGWGEVDPRRTSFRIWTLTLLVVVMVLHVSYSSSLITILTSDRVVLPFHDLQGLHDTRGEYTLGFEADSVMDKMFKGAVSDLFKQLHDDLISKHPEYVEDIREGLHRVVMDPKHAYIMSKLLVPKKDCRLLALPQRLFSSQMSMMMAKDLPAAPIINYAWVGTASCLYFSLT
ncbi:hypothetical protein FHG87_008892 [Trinorchestia longiramus]|nr:hypothetical protein FHG87_008892 [Trinorchestia longiramus]